MRVLVACLLLSGCVTIVRPAPAVLPVFEEPMTWQDYCLTDEGQDDGEPACPHRI